MVPETGLEPASLATHAPKACVSTNFTTRACLLFNYIKLGGKCKLNALDSIGGGGERDDLILYELKLSWIIACVETI